MARQRRAGAKIVLVGDHEQLQAIGAGAPFRAITEEIGHTELSEIRRQRVDWQREASVAFATHRTAEGLDAYHEHGNISFAESGGLARANVAGALVFQTNEREFAPGDRIVFLENNRDLGVKKGMLSTVQTV
ncbi:Ti-type conjugative transfer relaxase TraA (plasmid) [Rhizobium favelukesii]|uniref:Ti-type conjugative transfer relaxase TraA n=1 Tax=Rhizobium favelukesii TaxID=348824 RepID=W6RMD3_9HYPH|nr:AAA family ATPase [Rhizobium favelukesii]CDM60098.1 Ti-type conjugative transfer relaxase TraA [Rhizobium favelukesii]